MIASSSSSNSSGPVSVKPNYTMGEGGHEKGINCIDFYGGSDRPFLVTGSDDHTIRIWDYHTKSCVRVLEGHNNNVSAVTFHPQLPFLLSAGEDCTLRIWNAQTFRPEASYNFGMERAWGISCCRAHNSIGVAFDSGTIVFQLGKGDPCASMDPIQGRLVWSRARGSGSAGSHGNEILTGMVRLLDVEGRPIRVPADAEVIPLTPKELGTSDVFPQNLQHSPDGRLVAVWGDGEYVIYSTIGWRNRAFGRGVEIAWAAPGGDVFAARETSGRVMINRVSSHDHGIPLQGVTDCDRVFGGPLLGVSTAGSTLSFFDWTGEHLIRTIDVVATSVTWSPDASHLAIQTDSSCYILSANSAVLKSPQSFECGEDGIEDSLELVDELEQSLKSVTWISGNCFVYLTEENRLAYHMVGGDADESFQLALFDRSQFLLGFLPSEKRIYLTDQDLQVTSYAIMPSLITFQSSVLAGGDLSSALPLLESIPSTYYARLAVFLQRRGYLREALKISPDAHFQFDLAIQLNDLSLARELLSTKMSGEQEKWQELGRVALKAWNLPIAEEALDKAGDLASLFLLYAAAGDVDGLMHVAKEASKKFGHVNLAFAAYVKAGAYVSAFELLLSEGRASEAALFARTYGLSAENVAKAVEMWRVALIVKKKEKVAGSLADPVSHAEKFGDCKLGMVGNVNLMNNPGPRGRSVSFDGNVSVAGSSSTISLKPALEGEEIVSSTASTVGSAVGVAGVGVGLANLIDDYASDKFHVDAAGLSDDQMSMEVNTAGTGTRLEDLDEEEIDGGDEGAGGEAEEPEYESSIVEKETVRDVREVEYESGYAADEEYTAEYIETVEFTEPSEYTAEYTETVEFTEPSEYTETVEYTAEPADIIEPSEYTETVDYTAEPADIFEPSVAVEVPICETSAEGDESVHETSEPIASEPETDVLLEELNNLHVEESFNEGVLGVVENGGDVYDVDEAEYPLEESIEKVAEECENNLAEEPTVTHEGYEAFEYPIETSETIETTAGDDYDYALATEENGFEYPVEADDFAAVNSVATKAVKAKGSDEEFEAEEIDFGGEDDTAGWL